MLNFNLLQNLNSTPSLMYELYPLGLVLIYRLQLPIHITNPFWTTQGLFHFNRFRFDHKCKMNEITIIIDFIIFKSLIILESWRKTYFPCRSPHIFFNFDFKGVCFFTIKNCMDFSHCCNRLHLFGNRLQAVVAA